MHDGGVNPPIIFDLDGTLVDSLPGIAASLNHALEKQGLPTHPEGVVRTFVGNGLRLLVERGAGEANDAKVDALLEDFKIHYTEHWAEGTRPYRGITQLLMELQREGYQLAVLSNKVHDFTQTIARKIFPSVHFMVIQGQEDGIPHKPHPAGAFKIANSLGRNPRDCILIGDSVADVETASNADMHFIGVTWGYQDRPRLMEVGASRFIENPQGLHSVLRGMGSDVHA